MMQACWFGCLVEGGHVKRKSGSGRGRGDVSKSALKSINELGL
jgi:hypothetical protein